MKHEIVIAGFGGQGILSMGMTLAYAGMIEGLEVSWMPSYGPEMRGGTANCTVILSDEKISSPIINLFDTALILNQPSMDKFEAKIKSGGRVIYETKNILKPPVRKDVNIASIPAILEAVQLGNRRVMNMIILGAYLAMNPVLQIKSIIVALKKVLPDRHHPLIPINRKALERGIKLIHESKIS